MSDYVQPTVPSGIAQITQSLRESATANDPKLDDAEFEELLKSHTTQVEKLGQELMIAEKVEKWTKNLSLGVVGSAAVASAILEGVAAVAIPLSGIAGAVALGGFLCKLYMDSEIKQETEKLKNEIKVQT